MAASVVRALLLLVLAIGLAACATAPPSPPPEPASPTPPPPARLRSGTGTWNFGPSEACAATITASVASVSLSVRSDRVFYMVRLLPAEPQSRRGAVTMAYAGAAGTWSALGRYAARQSILFQATMNEDQASRILFLLDGGTLRLSDLTGQIAILRIPSAGSGGQVWFECVRQKLKM